MDTKRYWWVIRHYGAHLAITSSVMGSSFLTIGLYQKSPKIDTFIAGLFLVMAATFAHGLWLYAHTKFVGWSPMSGKMPNVLAISGIGAGAFLSLGAIAHEISKGSPSPWFGVWMLIIGGTFMAGLMVWVLLLVWEQALKKQ